jgi:hypothetical protein
MLTLTSREISRKANVAPHRSGLARIPKRCLLICTLPDARGSILRDCNHLWRVGAPHRETGANKVSICRYNMLDIFSRPLLFECRERLIEASAWQVCSANYFPYSA